MARNRRGSSQRWLREHRRDPFVAQAARAGFRARSVYKLVELDEKDRLTRAGMTAVDLGAAPGAWSQYLAQRAGPKGRVLALDIATMEPVEGVTFIQGDLRDEEVRSRLVEGLGPTRAGLVVSDMAPNMAGIRAVDQARAMDLAEVALEVACRLLTPGGTFLVKVFEGEGLDDYRRGLREAFGALHTRKPGASRDRSRELYLLGRDFLRPGQ